MSIARSKNIFVAAASLNPDSLESSQYSVDHFEGELCVSDGSFPVCVIGMIR